jgi:tetratricopeptide (TPR) repeat protein
MTLPALRSTVILSLNGKRLGTGFLIDDSGLLATCFHLVQNQPNSAEAAVGQILDFVTLGADGPEATGQAVVTQHFDFACDAALLQIQGELPAGLRPVRLIRGDHHLVAGAKFHLVGHAEIPDPKVQYGYYLAEGLIENMLPRNQVKVLKLNSKDLHKGMSGGAIYAPDLGGVVGMQSVRLTIDPKAGLWGKETGFACLSEAIAALSPVPLPLQEPTVVSSTALTRIRNINAQNINIQQMGSISAQTVMIGDLGLTESWHRPAEIRRRWQGDIPRQAELQEIRTRLTADSHSSVLALWGMPGSGKSTLAAQYAQQYSEAYPGGILWAELGSQFDPQQGVKAILTRWADWGYGGPKQLAQLMGHKRVDILPEDIFRLFSGHGKMLAVLDDVHEDEHLTQLLKALPPEADLLITMPSRQSLQGVALTLQPLEIQRLQANDAIAFLQSRLPQLPETLLTQLADTFDYHAHALVIVAAELQNSVAKLDTAQQLLHQPNHAVLGPIRTAFEFSYQQLPSERDRQYFQQLGIFSAIHPNFSAEMIAALWDASEETTLSVLETLCQRTLIAQLEDQRWSMNTLICHYASHLLEAQEPELRNITLERYRDYVFGLVSANDAWTVGHPNLPHLRYVGQQLVDQLAALYSFDLETLETSTIGEVTPEQRLHLEAVGFYVISAGKYLLQQEAHGFALQWFRALVIAGQLLGETAGVALGFFMLGQWHLSGEQSEHLEQACEMFHQAHHHWQPTGDIQSAGYALSGKGNTLRLQGKTQAALETFATALQEMDEANYEDWQLQATLLISLSRQYLIINEYDQACHYLAQATDLADGRLSDEFAIEVVQQFSVLLLNRGKPQEAMERLQQARDRANQIGNDQTLAESDISIGLTHFHLGESEAASDKFQHVLTQADALPYPRLKPPAMAGLAAIHCAQSEFQIAREYLEKALQLLEKCQDKSQEAQVLALLGEVTLALNEPQKALAHLQRALPLLSAVQDTTTGVRILDSIGLIYQKTDRIFEGLEYLKQALPTIRELNNAGAEVAILNWLAMLLNDVGDVSQAMAYFDQAEPIIANIENDIERATTLTVTAQLYRLIGKVDKAASTTQKVVETWRKLNNRPRLSEALMLLADISFHQSKLDRAQEILAEVNTLTQEDDQALARAQYYNLRGLLDLQAAHQQPTRIDDAQRMFERSSNINEYVRHPGLRMANLINLAWIRFNKQDFEGAQKDFEGALEIAQQQESPPHIASGLVNLGFLAYLRDGARSKASEYLQKAIKVMEEAGITTDSANQNIEMLRQFDRNVNQESADALPEESLKMLLSVDGWEGLRFLLQMRSASLLTDEAEQILVVTIATVKRKQQPALEKVLDYYRSLLDQCRLEGIPSMQSMQHEPEALAVAYWWAYLHRQGGNYGAALNYINQVLEINASDVDALIERGWIHRGLGRTAAAIADFEAVIKTHRREPRAYQGKGVVCFELGQLNEAVGALTKAIELAPNDSYNYQWRGTLYQAQEDFEAALKDLNRAVEITPQTSDHLYRRALVYLATKKFSDARRDLTTTIELDQKNEAILAFDYFWRGVANDLLKDAEGARIDWRQGNSYRQTGMGRWSGPLYESITPDRVEVEQQYHPLLDVAYPWHILPTHIRHYKLLAKLYPQQAAYPKARKILEQALQESSKKHSL